jgi:hypothetical protein
MNSKIEQTETRQPTSDEATKIARFEEQARRAQAREVSQMRGQR